MATLIPIRMLPLILETQTLEPDEEMCRETNDENPSEARTPSEKALLTMMPSNRN